MNAITVAGIRGGGTLSISGRDFGGETVPLFEHRFDGSPVELSCVVYLTEDIHRLVFRFEPSRGRTEESGVDVAEAFLRASDRWSAEEELVWARSVRFEGRLLPTQKTEDGLRITGDDPADIMSTLSGAGLSDRLPPSVRISLAAFYLSAAVLLWVLRKKKVLLGTVIAAVAVFCVFFVFVFTEGDRILRADIPLPGRASGSRSYSVEERRYSADGARVREIRFRSVQPDDRAAEYIELRSYSRLYPAEEFLEASRLVFDPIPVGSLRNGRLFLRVEGPMKAWYLHE